jgi:hypothetical protein
MLLLQLLGLHGIQSSKKKISMWSN